MSPPTQMTGDAARAELWICHLGRVPYGEALHAQEVIRTARQAGELPDTLLLLEHPAVYTRGRRSSENELSLSADFYRRQGIDIRTTNRGGKLTYHGPGQLVGYPIMLTSDITSHLRTMESAIIAALGDEGVQAHSRAKDGPDYTGVWVADRKIASIGVHVSHGVSMHGFAVNVENDLEPFSWVVACGLRGVNMTSVAEELKPGRPAGLAHFRERMAVRFCEAHARQQVLVSPDRLGVQLPALEATGQLAVLR